MVFHGIGCCVALLYVLFAIQQIHNTQRTQSPQRNIQLKPLRSVFSVFIVFVHPCYSSPNVRCKEQCPMNRTVTNKKYL